MTRLRGSGLRERTLVLIKPDGVLRGLCGEVLSRFERAGLSIVGLKMVQVPRQQAEFHYAAETGWLTSLGQKTLQVYGRHGRDPAAELGTGDPLAIGRIIRGWLIDYITQGPLVACVLEGALAVSTVRKLTGDTMPADALPGTIRGDLSTTSAAVANTLEAAVHNLVHASSSVAEAQREIEAWFGPHELCEYTPASWSAVYGPQAAAPPDAATAPGRPSRP